MRCDSILMSVQLRKFKSELLDDTSECIYLDTELEMLIIYLDIVC